MSDQHARLRAEIDELEHDLAELEADLLDIQREFDLFAARYDQIVRPKVDRLELIQQMIKDLENELIQSDPPAHGPEGWRPPPGYVPVEEQFRRVWRSPDASHAEPKKTLHSEWQPPKDYVPVEEQFRRVWGRPIKNTASDSDTGTATPTESAGTAGDPKALKQLFRKLARRFHPDLTTDSAERERRNRIMAEINAAYSRRDLAALHMLDQQPENAASYQPLAALQQHELRRVRDQLAARLSALRQERHVLMSSDMMELKLQASLLARSGRDLLREMAERLERDYVTCLDRLDQLRRASDDR